MLTIRLVLYIFYNKVQSKLDSSHAMGAGDTWIGQLAMFISRRCDLFRWYAVFRRCRRRRRVSTGSQIATWRRSLTRTRHDHCWRKRCSSNCRRFSLNPVQRNILPHRQSQLSDLTIRLHITTSLKSISQKRWLYHQYSNGPFDQFSSISVNHVTNYSSSSLVKSPIADLYRYGRS